MSANQKFEASNYGPAATEDSPVDSKDIETLREQAALLIANATSWILGPVYVATSELKDRAKRLCRDISRGF